MAARNCKNIVVLYGSGASYDSGYQVGSPSPRAKGATPDSKGMIKPPMDRDFFGKTLKIWKRYYSLQLFIKTYFGYEDNLSLEEVWSAVDLNLKHIRLKTYDWREETAKYLKHFPKRRKYFDIRATEFLGDCGRDLHQLIYRIYAFPKKTKKDNYGKLHKLLNAKKANIEYITFNYDCILEESLKSAKIDFGYVSPVTDMQRAFQPNYSHVLKLHGSLSWRHRISEQFHPFTIPSSDDPIMPVPPDYKKNIEPAIIPPTWAKGDINNPEDASQSRLGQLVLYQWRYAFEVIKKADAIMVIGYSFPRTDLHTTRLLRLGIAKKRIRKPMPIAWCGGRDQVNKTDKKSVENREYKNFKELLPKKRARVAEPIEGFRNLCDDKNFEVLYKELFPKN